MHVISPFSFPIVAFTPDNSAQLVDEVAKHASELEATDPNGGVLSEGWNKGERATSINDYENGGYTSFYTHKIMELPQFDGIHHSAMQAFHAYLHAMGRGDSPYFLQNSWVSTYGRGHFVPEHIHTFSHLSCVFYASATKGTGKIVFKNPALPVYGMLQDQNSNLFNDVQRLDPEVGTFYVFPSFMPHYTEPHESDDKRIIFSSNMILTKSYLGKPMWHTQGDTQ